MKKYVHLTTRNCIRFCVLDVTILPSIVGGFAYCISEL
jgi:hypothetical protein